MAEILDYAVTPFDPGYETIPSDEQEAAWQRYLIEIYIPYLEAQGAPALDPYLYANLVNAKKSEFFHTYYPELYPTPEPTTGGDGDDKIVTAEGWAKEYYRLLELWKAAVAEEKETLGYNSEALLTTEPNPKDYGLVQMDNGEWVVPFSSTYAGMWSGGVGGGGVPSGGWTSPRPTSAELQKLSKQPWEYAFYQTLGGIDGPPNYLQWFESNFSQFMKRFQGTLETEPSNIYGAGRAKAAWADWLEQKEPQFRQEFQALGAYGRGERPDIYSPTIKTVEPYAKF